MLVGTALVLFAIDFWWRAGDHLEHDKTPWGQLALSAVAVGALGAASWLGSTSTYRHGVRVAGPPARDAEGPDPPA